jgi:hypothetical protein
MERMAEVLGGCDVDPLDGWYDAGTGALRLKDVELGHPVWVDIHPDPLADAIRARSVEGELVQAMGRARGIRRDSSTPLQIDIFVRDPLPGIEVDELLLWEEVCSPNLTDHLLARWGIILNPQSRHGSADVIAALLPDRFKDGKAVQNWLSAGGDRSLTDSSIRTLLEDSDSEERVRGFFKLTPESRYSLEAAQFYDKRPPLVPVGDWVLEKRTGTLLTGRTWRSKSEQPDIVMTFGLTEIAKP